MANPPAVSSGRRPSPGLLIGLGLLVVLVIGFLVWYLPRASEPMGGMTVEQKAAEMREANKSIRSRNGGSPGNVSR